MFTLRVVTQEVGDVLPVCVSALPVLALIITVRLCHSAGGRWGSSTVPAVTKQPGTCKKDSKRERESVCVRERESVCV